MNYLIDLQLQATDEKKPLAKGLSGLVVTPDGHLWLISDETASIERLTKINDHTFGEHTRFPLSHFFDLPGEPNSEVDLEGITYDAPYLWVVGSHSRKFKSSKTPADLRAKKIDASPRRCFLARIPVVQGQLVAEAQDPQTGESFTSAMLEISDNRNQLLESLADDEHLAPFLQIPGKANGLDIEGLAVRGNRVFIGLRGPVLWNRAIVLSVLAETKKTNPHFLHLKKIGSNERRYQKHWLQLDGLGVRDLAIRGDEFLILSGPTMFLDGPARLHRLSLQDLLEDSDHPAPPLLEIACSVGFNHPEGITPYLGLNTMGDLAPGVLMVYDAPSDRYLSAPDGARAEWYPLPFEETT